MISHTLSHKQLTPKYLQMYPKSLIFYAWIINDLHYLTTIILDL